MSSASTKTRPYRPGLNPPAPLTFRIIFAGALSVPSTTWLKLEADLSTSLVSERDARCLGSTGTTWAILRYASVYDRGGQESPPARNRPSTTSSTTPRAGWVPRASIYTAGRPSEVDRIALSPANANRWLDWTAKISLVEWLRKAVAWFRRL